jgi:hypothetical protein
VKGVRIGLVGFQDLPADAGHKEEQECLFLGVRA